MLKFGNSPAPVSTHHEPVSDVWNKITNGTTISGDIQTASNILIEGEVKGNVICGGKVHIGVTGRIIGNINCTNAEFEGYLEGELNIENLLSLKSTAKIKGNIQTVKLHIEEGAYFEGSCSMKSNIRQSATAEDFKV
ncbi:MAG: hypothetical protein RL264_1854 [Bacteroidota bacterium]|jgi:cytoskeletal protein CcmA (bactofilin family)